MTGRGSDRSRQRSASSAAHSARASTGEGDPARTGSVVYHYVSDADALHAEWVAAGVEGRIGDPADTAWGLREFGYVDPEGTLHRVGSPLEPA